MQINWKREILPHLIAILIFILLAVAYCYPVLQGERLQQSDLLQVKAMMHEAQDFYEKTGEAPLWSNSMFSGMPTYLLYTGPSANKATFLNRLTTFWLPQPISYLFIAMLGVYFLLLVMRFKYWTGLFGGVAYGFSSYNVIIIGVGHATKIMTMAWMAPLLAGILLIYRKKYLSGSIVTALSSMMMLRNDHIQIIYYMVILLFFFVVWKFILALKKKELKSFVIASLISLAAGFLGIIPSIPKLITTQKFAPYTIRDSQSKLTLTNNSNSQITKGGLDIGYAFQWSLGKLETLSVLIPNIYGGPAHSRDFLNTSKTYEQLNSMGASPQQAAGISQATLYWGPQPFTTPIYFGAIICFLFILSFFLVKSKHKWWLVAVTIISFLMAWGNNLESLNSFLFHHLPLFNKFRTPSMIMIIPQLTFVILGCWALNEALDKKTDKKAVFDALKKSLYVAGGLIILAWITVAGLLNYSGANDASLAQQIGEKAMDMLRESIQKDRAALFSFDALRSLAFIVLAWGLIWFYLKEKIKAKNLAIFLGILLILDLFVLDKRYLNKDNYVPEDNIVNFYQPSEADKQIAADPDPDFRVLNLSKGLNSVFNDASTSYFHKSVGGYSPAKLWIYQDLIDHQIMPSLQHIYSNLQNKDTQEKAVSLMTRTPVLNMLNTKYYILNPNGTPIMNPGALGVAWFADSIHWAEDENKEMLALSDFDPATTAVLNKSYQSQIQDSGISPDSSATVKLTAYGLNTLKYESNNSQKGLAVFSEIYYPEWKAYVDGKETSILRVNYALRGLELSAGKHEIEFRLHPSSFYAGQKLAGISSSLLILLFVLGLGFEFYKNHKITERDPQ